MDEWNQSGNTPETPQQPQQPPQPPYNPYGWGSYTPYQEPPQPPRKKKHTGLKIAVGILVSVCVVTVLAGAVLFAIGGLPLLTETETKKPINPNAPTLQITELDEDAQGLSTTEIVDRNLNSTVLLTIYTNSSSGFGQSGGEAEKAGFASGIVMTADGYIITNWHCVVDETTGKEFPRVDITMYDGTVFESVDVVGYDSSTDLAVIKVDGQDLIPAEFGDSDQLKMGNKVVALGNSGGMGWSTTQGIVSGLARDVYEDTGYAIKCIQVDAAINPGNSGGPLFNAAGQCIAVNSAKIVADGYEGIGFAIPIKEAKVIIDDLISNGYVTGRVALGITGQSYDDSYYQGFLIYSIEANSPLKDTQVKANDLIVAVNDTKVTSYADLRSALSQYTVGDVVTLTLLRAERRDVVEFTVSVKLVESKG